MTGEVNYGSDGRIAAKELVCNGDRPARTDKEKSKSISNLSMMNEGVGADLVGKDDIPLGSVNDHFPGLPGPGASQASHLHQKLQWKSCSLVAEKEPFKGASDKPMIMVNYGGEDTQFSASEISSMLTNLHEITEENYGSPVNHAVINNPAYLNDSQRQTINVVRIISDPTAVAIAFGLDKKTSGREKNVLVFDVGGGNFDVPLIAIDSNCFKPKASAEPTEKFAYYCKDNGMTFHPCSLRLPSKLFTPDNIELELCENLSSKCLVCDKKRLKATLSGSSGLSYVSKCKDYNLHAVCMLEKFQLVEGEDGNFGLVLTFPKQSTKSAGKNSLRERSQSSTIFFRALLVLLLVSSRIVC